MIRLELESGVWWNLIVQTCSEGPFFQQHVITPRYTLMSLLLHHNCHNQPQPSKPAWNATYQELSHCLNTQFPPGGLVLGGCGIWPWTWGRGALLDGYNCLDSGLSSLFPPLLLHKQVQSLGSHSHALPVMIDFSHHQQSKSSL